MAVEQINGRALDGRPVSANYRGLADTDAFSRLRVSGTGQRVDSTFSYDKQPLLFDEIVVGNGTATHDANLRAVYLSTGGTDSGDSARLALRFYTPYTPGNSQLIAITGALNPDDVDFTNAYAEIGYGDSANGVGFGYDENGAYLFLRTSISGSATTNKVYQRQWDNYSATTDVKWRYSQIFLIDFQSLAVGLIRFYMDREGALIEVHRIQNDNLRTGPYWQLASLPPYWQVTNTGVANATCRILAICVTVKSEGGVALENLPGFPFGTSRAALVQVSTTLLPVISIQVQTTFNSLPYRALVFPELIEAYADDQPAEFRVVLNPTLTDASFAQVNASSGVYADTSATAMSGGRTIGIFYASASNRGGVASANIAGRAPLSTYGATPTGDILTIGALRAGGTNANVKAAIEWREVR